MNKNKELHELLGLEWHTVLYLSTPPAPHWECSCRRAFFDYYLMTEHLKKNSPDYAADPRLVLREMMKRDDFDRFISNINAFSLDEDNDLINNAVPVDLIMDTTGKLADIAIEWLKTPQNNP